MEEGIEGEQSDPLCINHCRLSFKPFGFVRDIYIRHISPM